MLAQLPILVLFSFSILVDQSSAARPRPSILKRRNPSYAPLQPESFEELANLTNLNTILDFNDPHSALSKLLVPRPAGSKALSNLQSMVSAHFKRLNWHIEEDQFEDTTPVGARSFKNLIFTHDPSAPRRLVLAAHIDSKYFPDPPEDEFVGATDSAAPCAILMDLAEALTPWLDERRTRVEAAGGEQGAPGQGESLQIIFFDGEEAFQEWTHTDSIYGARHLVKKWLKPTSSPSPTSPKSKNTLSRISHLVLLDLLGAVYPVVRSYYPETGWFFDEFGHSEERLGVSGHLWEGVRGDYYLGAASAPVSRERSFFVSRKAFTGFSGAVEDDHLPFVQNGVPVVHLITLPFPSVWHTIGDDVTALDLPTIKAWAMIVRLTVAEYLGLDPLLPIPAPEDERARAKRAKGDL
ncbi:hypothetical protein T439DRAFT_310525 [Meredithblackwellia eburnea MCA 4105]